MEPFSALCCLKIMRFFFFFWKNLPTRNTEPLPSTLCAWLESLHIIVFDSSEMFCPLLFALLQVHTLYIKSQVAGKVRKTGCKKHTHTHTLKPPVAVFHFYHSFVSFSFPLFPVYSHILGVGKSIAFRKRAEALIQRSCDCQEKYDLLFASISFELAWVKKKKNNTFFCVWKCGRDLASRERERCASVLPFVCTAANERGHAIALASWKATFF